MAILVKIDGIDGRSEIKDKWIEVSNLEWEIGRNIPTKTGQVTDRTSDLPHASEIVLRRKMDATAARLFEAACGTKGKKVEIHFLSGAGKEAPSYAEWTLEDTLVSKYEIKATSDAAEELIHLNFTKIEVKSIERGKDDAGGSPYPVKFDRAKGVLG